MISKTIPTLSEIEEQLTENIYNSLGVVKKPRFSVAAIIAKAVAPVVLSLYYFIEHLSKSLLPDSAKKDILTRWAAIWGVFRKPAAFAEGSFEFSGTDGVGIPEGTRIVWDSRQYVVLEDGEVAAGKVVVRARATVEGKGGNLPAGKAIVLVSPIAGITSIGMSHTISGGADIEEDTSLRARLLARIRNPPQGGSAHDYVSWAKEVPGVTRAWAYRSFKGPGTVGVTFVTDNEENIVPEPSSVIAERVRTHIESKQPFPADSFVFPPKPKLIKLKIKLIPDTSKVRSQVIEELKDLFFREASAGGAYKSSGVIALSKIREAISTAEGEEDHELLSPKTSIKVEKGEIAVLGEIAWS